MNVIMILILSRPTKFYRYIYRLFLGDVRSDVDFTDMMWSAMAGDLTSYSELCNSLHLILNTIKQDEIRYFMNIIIYQFSPL